MTTQELQQPVQNPAEHNSKRIRRLAHGLEKLIELIEEQRLVEPASLTPIKIELHEIQKAL